MSDKPSNKQNQSDEIDLGQLFAAIGKGFDSLFRGLLTFFVYLKKNAVILVGLVIIGGLIGFSLKFIVGEEKKLDVIVTPNLDAKDYLYGVIDEIQSDIKAKDTVFFNSLGMSIDELGDFKIEITRLKKPSATDPEEEMKFLEILKDFENNETIAGFLRSELQDKTTRNERITFYFDDDEIGEDYAGKIMSYINSNPYYLELVKVYNENAQNRIIQNDSLIKQLDMLINYYAKNMLKEETRTEGSLVLENQEPLNIPSLFQLKNVLIKDTEVKKLELERRKEAITVVSFGKPHKVQKPIFRENIALIPLIFVGLFFLLSFIRLLNRKAKEMHIH